jgi:hypothetical protein
MSGGALGNIPYWIYVAVAVVGLVAGIVLLIVSGKSRRRPGAQPGAGVVPMVFGILSLVLLVLVPLVLLAITLSSGASEDRYSYRTGGRDFDRGGTASNSFGATRGDMPVTPAAPPPLTAQTMAGRWTTGSTGCVVIFSADGRWGIDGSPMSNRYTISGDIMTSITGGHSMSYRIRYYDGRTMRREAVDHNYPDTLTRCDSGPSPAPAVSATGGTDGGANLATALSRAADEFRPRLPLRNGPATIPAVEATGTILNLYMTIAADLSGAQWSQLESSLRASTCRGSFARPIAAGASVSYQMLDAGEEQRSFTVSSC